MDRQSIKSYSLRLSYFLNVSGHIISRFDSAAASDQPAAAEVKTEFEEGQIRAFVACIVGGGCSSTGAAARMAV